MKKVLITIIVFLSISTIANGQLNNPQYHFYKPKDILINEEFNNAIEEYDFLANEFHNPSNNFNQRLSILYRMYIIEKENWITYSTIDDKAIPFRCENSPEGKMVDFGAQLISNVDNAPYALYSKSFTLQFGNPVKRIDPLLFNQSVDGICLPSTLNLLYQSSPDIRVDNLSSIKGTDVINQQSLVSRDGTLIVAAIASMDSYVIPEQVKNIGAGALRGSKSNAVVIPESVSHIGERAFDLSNITNFYFLPTNPPELEDYVFGDNLNKNFTVFVPKKQIKLYKNTYPYFSNHIKSIEKDKGDFYYILAESKMDSDDITETFDLLELAANKGNSKANYMLGIICLLTTPEIYQLLSDEDIEDLSELITMRTKNFADSDKAIKYLIKAAKKGHVESMEELCCYYFLLKKDVRSAKKWAKRLAKIDYKKASLLGDLYLLPIDHQVASTALLGDYYLQFVDKGYTFDLKKAKKEYQNAYKIYMDNQDVFHAEITQETIERIDYLISKNADKKIKFKCDEDHFNGDLLEWEMFDTFKNQEFYLLDLEQKMLESEFLIDTIDEDEAFLLTWRVIKKWEQSGLVSIK